MEGDGPAVAEVGGASTVTDPYVDLIRMMVDFHPSLWHEAAWEVGKGLTDRIFALRSPGGVLVYDPAPGTLMGWPVHWVDGEGIRLVVGQDRQSPAEYYRISEEQYRDMMDRLKKGTAG